jgi:hypothetical protein
MSLVAGFSLGMASCGASGSQTVSVSGESSTTYSENDNKFSMWMPYGANQYYTEYSDNPAVRYETQFKTGEKTKPSLA